VPDNVGFAQDAEPFRPSDPPYGFRDPGRNRTAKTMFTMDSTRRITPSRNFLDATGGRFGNPSGSFDYEMQTEVRREVLRRLSSAELERSDRHALLLHESGIDQRAGGSSPCQPQ
jgi:hypothetical protein